MSSSYGSSGPEVVVRAVTTRTRITEVALELFGRLGYVDTLVDAIGENAGVPARRFISTSTGHWILVTPTAASHGNDDALRQRDDDTEGHEERDASGNESGGLPFQRCIGLRWKEELSGQILHAGSFVCQGM
nr:hypothetical protein [Mycolicibacter kumamotonensis]